MTSSEGPLFSLASGPPNRKPTTCNTVDWTRWLQKITAQRGPAPRSCIGPHAQVLHWAPHLLGCTWGHVTVYPTELRPCNACALLALQWKATTQSWLYVSVRWNTWSWKPSIIPIKDEHGSGLDRTESGQKLILAGTGQDWTENFFVVLIWLFWKYQKI